MPKNKVETAASIPQTETIQSDGTVASLEFNQSAKNAAENMVY